MQLDKTRIAIRERGLLATLDLSLHVIREYLAPLTAAWLSAVIPLSLFNHLLIGWMVQIDYDDGGRSRYIWNLLVLTFLETPLLSIPIVGFLGPAVFMEEPKLRRILSDAFRYTVHLVWSLLILRGILAAWILYLFVPRERFDAFLEGVLMVMLVLYAGLLQAIRPYTTEIILLERTPLFPKDERSVSFSRRSKGLHEPAGDLLARWIAASCVGFSLMAMLVGTFEIGFETLFNESGFSSWNIVWLLPIPLWIGAGYLAVVRFLSYLDLRIRNEGWEVELLLMAEGTRAHNRIT